MSNNIRRRVSVNLYLRTTRLSPDRRAQIALARFLLLALACEDNKPIIPTGPPDGGGGDGTGRSSGQIGSSGGSLSLTGAGDTSLRLLSLWSSDQRRSAKRLLPAIGVGNSYGAGPPHRCGTSRVPSVSS
jgi:hypothetical protein